MTVALENIDKELLRQHFVGEDGVVFCPKTGYLLLVIADKKGNYGNKQ